MQPHIDFRNARYQGQLQNTLPHGVGILLDKDFTFCLCEWVDGSINGYAMIVYPTGRIFCGTIQGKEARELSLFELENSNVQVLTYTRGKELTVVALMPYFKTILEIDTSAVVSQHEYNPAQYNTDLLSKLLRIQPSTTLLPFRNCLQFMVQVFVDRYPEFIQYVIVSNKNRKEYFIGLKGEGLGIKLEPAEQLSTDKISRAYIVRAVGHFSVDNSLTQIGMKCVDNVMKGLIKEEGCFNRNQIVRYEEGERPNQCSRIFYCYLKESLKYSDKVISMKYLHEIGESIRSFEGKLKLSHTDRIAQAIIERPNNDQQLLEQIGKMRAQKALETEKFNRSKALGYETPNLLDQARPVRATSPTFDLEKVKEEIFKSVTRKKATERQMKDYQQPKITPQKVNRREEELNRDSIQASYEKNPERRQSSRERIAQFEKSYVSPYKYKPQELPERTPPRDDKANKSKPKVRFIEPSEDRDISPLKETPLPRGRKPKYEYHFEEDINKLLPREIPPSKSFTSNRKESPNRRQLFSRNAFE